jgi:hypothetical protein
MNRNRALVLAGCLLALWGSAGPVSAQFNQYNPYTASPYYGQRARLPPILNLIRDQEPDAINYFLGTVPERERRFNQGQFSRQIRGLESREPTNVFISGEEAIPDVPTVGRPRGSRTSDSFFRDDAVIANNRARPAFRTQGQGTRIPGVRTR